MVGEQMTTEAGSLHGGAYVAEQTGWLTSKQKNMLIQLFSQAKAHFPSLHSDTVSEDMGIF